MLSRYSQWGLKSTTFIHVMVALAFCAGLMGPSSVIASEDEINSLVNDFKKAWEALDLARIENLFDLDYGIAYYPAETMEVDGGAEGLRTYFREAAKHFTDIKLTVKNTRADVFGDTAYAAFLWRFEYKWDGAPGASDGRSTLVLRKKDGKWKIIHYHESVPIQ